VTFAAGDRPTALQLNDLAVLAVIKAADESRNTTTTLANDSELTLAVAASTTYLWEACIFFDSNATADYKGQWSVPASASGRFQCTGYALGGAFGMFDNATIGTVQANEGPVAGVVRPHFMTGSLTISTTAGNFRWQWAQNTSNGTATITKAGSYMKMWKVA
jgi:hypothetical protein